MPDSYIPKPKTIEITIHDDGRYDWQQLQTCKESVSEITHFFSGHIQLDQLKDLLNEIIQTYPTFWKEINQVAAFSDISPHMLLAINVLYDVTSSLFGCTAFAFSGETGPVHCHCLDWELGQEVLEHNTVLICFKSESGEVLFTSIGWPGFLGVYYGIATQKFSITLNAVWSKEKRHPGIPLGLFLRNVFLKAQNYNAALDMLETTRFGCDGILLISGTKADEIAIVERTPSQFATRKYEGRPILATNHFVDLAEGMNQPGYVVTDEEPFGLGSLERFNEVRLLFSQNPPQTTEDCVNYLTQSPFINDLTIHRTIFEAKIGEFKMSSVKQRQLWFSFPEGHTIDELIAKSAIHNKTHIAVRDYNKDYTYVDVLYQATSIAMALKEKGVNKGDTVCLMCERAFPGLTAAIGIMMRGAIYVPISVEYPEARKQFIVQDSQARIIITDNRADTLIQNQATVVTISDLTAPHIRTVTDKNVATVTGGHVPEDPAYILYTSGSTGRPKGVVVSHQAQLNTFSWMIHDFSLHSGECIPQKTPWSFTDSLWEMFLPLIVGGVVGFVSEHQIRNPVELYTRLNELDAVITQFVPPAMTVFLDEIERSIPLPKLPCLRWILNGGEELPRKIIDRWFNIFPDVGYANSYGMTESAIYATCYFMKEPPVWGMRRIPVGTPIHNAKIYILSDEGELLPKDSIGEICVGGQSLMTEYWKQPDLTQKAFATHPTTGEKLYRTGDYGAFRIDGQIAYLGRKDDQVKILGMRVELKEIQRVMLDHPAVKQAYLVTNGEDESKFIVAFYTTINTTVEETALLSYLRTILPIYMVPAICIHLDKLPLTEHNKTDLKMLAKIAKERNVAIPENSVFKGEMEKEISAIWKKNLGHANFGPNDPFFYVGGNSLMLIQIYGQLPQRYKNLLTIPDLLSHPTIRDISVFIHKKEKHTTDDTKINKKKRFGRLSQRRARKTYVR